MPSEVAIARLECVARITATKAQVILAMRRAYVVDLLERGHGVRLGRLTTLHKRADEVMALKRQGMGLRAISRELGMAVSSVHSVLAGRKLKR